MAQFNKVFLIGNLTRDPEVRYTPKGSAVADIGLATNRSWRSESGEEKEDVRLTNLKLQKILYYAQGWYLANFTKPLFKDEIQAWKFGPAIYSIYKAFEKYGSLPITEVVTKNELSEINQKDKKFLDEVWGVYKKYSGTDLMQSTHNEKPWKDTRLDITESANSETVIQIISILEYFKSLKDQT